MSSRPSKPRSAILFDGRRDERMGKPTRSSPIFAASCLLLAGCSEDEEKPYRKVAQGRDMVPYRRTPIDVEWTGFAFVGAPGLGLVH